MAFSKNHLYNPTDQITANYFHAFGHGARIQIIKQLLFSGPIPVQVIARDHPIHIESLSGHLKILRNFQLVEWEEKYPHTYYAVHKENLWKAGQYFTDFVEIMQAVD